MRVEDMLENIRVIQEFTAELDQENFLKNKLVVYAVVAAFTNIGEAARFIPAEIEERWPDVPWYEMRGMRNVVVHEYFGWSREILWRTIQDELPSVVPNLEKMLEEEKFDNS